MTLFGMMQSGATLYAVDGEYTAVLRGKTYPATREEFLSMLDDREVQIMGTDWVTGEVTYRYRKQKH